MNLVVKILTLLVIIKLHTVVYCHQNHNQEQNAFQGRAGQPNSGGHGGHGGEHDHDTPRDQVKSNINSDHVLEHLDGVINKPKDQMTPEEQNFYYFKLHDYDNNNKLDGLELVSAFAHNEEHKIQDENNANNNETKEHHRISDDELTKLIDEIMKDEDKNHDGYITYQEFVLAISK